MPVEKGLVQWTPGKKGAKPILVARLPDGRSASLALDKGAWKIDANPKYQCALIQCYNGTDLFDALNRDREGKCDGPVDVETVIFAFVVAGKQGALSIKAVGYRNEYRMPLFGSVWSPEGDHMLITRDPGQYRYAAVPELLSRLSEGKLTVIESVDEPRPDGMRVRWPQVFLGWTDAHRFRFRIGGGHDSEDRQDCEFNVLEGTRRAVARSVMDTSSQEPAMAGPMAAVQPAARVSSAGRFGTWELLVGLAAGIMIGGLAMVLIRRCRTAKEVEASRDSH